MATWPTPQKNEIPGPNREYRSTTNAYRGEKKVQPMLCDVTAIGESELSALTASSVDSHAKTSARRGSVPDWRGPGVDSGASSPDSLASYDPALRSWRTCQGSLLSASTPFSGIWPRSGMTRNGRLSARRMLARRTGGSGCSSSLIQWPTATSGDAKASGSRELAGSNTSGMSLTDAVRPDRAKSASWPTPRSEDSESSGARHSRGTVDTLTSATRQEWPTARTRDQKGGYQGGRVRNGQISFDTLDVAVQAMEPNGLAGLRDRERPSTSGSRHEWCTPVRPEGGRTNRGGARQDEPLFVGQVKEQTTGDRHAPVVLNQRWVLTLMGFPPDYLDGVEPPSRPSGMRSSRK